jgi:hypothetical protein
MLVERRREMRSLDKISLYNRTYFRSLILTCRVCCWVENGFYIWNGEEERNKDDESYDAIEDETPHHRSGNGFGGRFDLLRKMSCRIRH